VEGEVLEGRLGPSRAKINPNPDSILKSWDEGKMDE
jgi:hypothetical protein